MKTVKIKKIVKNSKRQDVYNMEVKDTHNFSVNNGYIVHNCRYAIEEKTTGNVSILDAL